MNIMRIKTFLAIVISGTFTEAAEVMYTTQATVSKHILSLERELGVALFDRSHRKPQLTQAGQAFIKYAERLLDTYNAMSEELAALSDSNSGSTFVASIPVMAHYGIIAIISSFRNRHREVQVIVDERESCDILQALDEHQYEMAFFRAEGLDPKKHQQIKLCEDRLSAVLPASHPLARRECVSIGELKDEAFMLLGKHTGLYDYIVKTCKRLGGFAPDVSYTGTRMENIMEMVGQGMGVSLLMETPARYVLRPGAVIVPIKEDVKSQVVLAKLRRRKLSPAAEVFWNYVRKLGAMKDAPGDAPM